MKRVSFVDFSQLVPGGRLLLRDWRDGSLIEATFFAFQALRSVSLGPTQTALQGQTFVFLRRNEMARYVRLVVHRDFFCGLTWLPPKDVVELLPDGTDRDRFERLVPFFESEARDCRACRVFTESPESYAATREKHKGDPYGGVWCTGRAVIPEMQKLLAAMDKSEAP